MRFSGWTEYDDAVRARFQELYNQHCADFGQPKGAKNDFAVGWRLMSQVEEELGLTQVEARKMWGDRS